MALFNRLAEFVDLAFFWRVANSVNIGRDADNFVRSEESVFNSLLERVGVNRFAKIMKLEGSVSNRTAPKHPPSDAAFSLIYQQVGEG